MCVLRVPSIWKEGILVYIVSLALQRWNKRRVPQRP